MGTLGQRFWEWPHVAHLFGVEWTPDVISKRAETDHYTYKQGSFVEDETIKRIKKIKKTP